MSDWHDLLRAHRLSRRLTQAELATRAGISPEMLSRIERGKAPHTDARRLAGIAAALELDAAETGELFAAAGRELPGAIVDLAGEQTFDAGLAVIAGYPWPCLLLNDRIEIVAANALARAVVGSSLLGQLLRSHDHNLVRLLAQPAVRARLLNWEAFASALAGFAVTRGLQLGGGATSRYAATLNERLQAQQRLLHARLTEIWRRSPADTARVATALHWRAADGSTLRFAAVLSLWSAHEGLWALDLHPADAATLAWLAAQPQRPTDPRALACRVGNWPELLHDARRALGLTQAELAPLVGRGISISSLTSYETGRRRPPPDVVLDLERALELDRLTRNRLLRALGRPQAPEPSRGAPAETAADRAALQRRVEAQRWPALVIDVGQRCRIAAANSAALALYGERLPESLIALLLQRRFRRRALNWEEATSAILPSTLRQALTDDSQRLPDWLRDVLAAVHREDAGVLRRLSELFAAVAPTQPTGRAVTPLIWRPDQGEPLSFTCVVSRWNEGDTLWALDLFPADAETWSRLAPGAWPPH